MISYQIKLSFQNQDDKNRVIKTLEAQRLAFNEASKSVFGSPSDGPIKPSIVSLHSKFYKNFRVKHPEIPSNIIIAAENECISQYNSVKSKKHKISEALCKKQLSCYLNDRLYSFPLVDKSKIKITAMEGKRICATLDLYDKVTDLLKKYETGSPSLFVRGRDIYINLFFKISHPSLPQNIQALGVDVGLRRTASTSEGKIFHDKQYLKNKRKTRFLKRQLQSCIHTKKSKSAKRKLKKLRRKEANQTKNFCHHLANNILKTEANVIVLEDLSKIKERKGKKKYQNLNKLSQVPFYKIKQFLTYKAPLVGKRVEVVCPSYTSQIDFRTGKKDGKRQGCRYIGKDGVVLDADLNAANNIALRSKLPVSSITLCSGLDGSALLNGVVPKGTTRQAVVNRPIVEQFIA